MSRTGRPARHRLILLRHARADHGGGPDVERTLNAAGRRQADHVGALLAERGDVPDLVLCSSAARTRQTYERLAAVLDAGPAVEHTDALYATASGRVLKLLRGVPEPIGTVLVVGHEPTMSDFAAELAGPGSDPGAAARVRVGIPTAAFCVLDVPTAWSDVAAGGAVLTEVVVPHSGHH